MSEHNVAISEMDFDADEDLRPKSIPVKHRGVKYVLIEAGADTAAKFRNASAKCGKRDADGNMSIGDGIGDVEPYLVSLCLCQTEPDGSIKLNGQKKPVTVSLHIILSWQNRVVRPMFDWIKANSDLNEKAETREELEKEAARIQKKLTAMALGKEDPAKNEQNDGQAT